ncbi:FMN-binding protein, partial [Sutterella wadsworthensis]|uniref:FMN-binding protein n=1 Tax=Sutterella wadsworthensis TaxID=40545 RepID=UPI0032BFCD81
EEKNYNNNYRYVLELDVENGNISNVNFDSVNKDGESKRNDKEYIKLMSEKSGTSPDIFLDALEDDLEKVKNPDDVEVISGATHTVDSFKEYAKKLIEQAEEGNTKVIIVDNKTE